MRTKRVRKNRWGHPLYHRQQRRRSMLIAALFFFGMILVFGLVGGIEIGYIRLP